MAPHLSRRSLLLAAGSATATAAVAAFVRARRSDSPAHPTSHIPGPTSTPAAPSGPTSPSPLLPSPSPAPARGGVGRIVSLRSFSFDTFDAQRSGDVSVLEVLGRTHSRIVDWENPVRAVLGPGLADSWEQPSETTWTFQVDPRAAWHDHPALPGRVLTADDLVAHLQRTLDLGSGTALPVAQRGWDYASIERVSAPDAATLVIETSSPDPFLLQTLAGPFALVQRPEAVEVFADTWRECSPETIAGSGSFHFQGYVDGGALHFTAAERGHAPPSLDELFVLPPSRDIAPFLDGDVHEFAARDRRDAAEIRAAAISEIIELPLFEDSPVITSLHVGSDPWRDANLRLALSAALNRRRLAGALVGGRAAPAGHVAPAHETFALTESELAAYPGYRLDADEDAREAAQRWQAGAGAALGEITIDFPSVFDPRYSASSVVTGLLAEALAPSTFRPAVDSYPNIASRAAAGEYGNGTPAFWFGWGPPLSSPDPSLSLFETYHATSATAASVGFADPSLDRLLDRLRTAFDPEDRRITVREVAHHLLSTTGGGIIPWLLQRSELFRWSRLDAPAPSAFWHQHRDRVITIRSGSRR